MVDTVQIVQENTVSGVEGEHKLTTLTWIMFWFSLIRGHTCLSRLQYNTHNDQIHQRHIYNLVLIWKETLLPKCEELQFVTRKLLSVKFCHCECCEKTRHTGADKNARTFVQQCPRVNLPTRLAQDILCFQ